MQKHEKGPGEELSYGFHWRSTERSIPPYLEPGEVLTTSVWTVRREDEGALVPGEFTIIDGGIQGDITLVKAAGGTLGRVYLLENAVNTSLLNRPVRTKRIVMVLR